MSFTKISVLVPTRHRVDRLRTLLASYDATTADDGHCSELVFRVDEDDLASQDFLVHHCDHRIVVGPRHRGYDSMPVFYNEMADQASGDVFMCGNDDMVFKTGNWASSILEAARLYPDGLFDFGVSTHNETHYPFSIVSRKAVQCLGFLWDPRIFWGDIYLRDVMAYFGRTIMLSAVEIEHDWAGHRPDQVFRESDKDIVRRNPTYWSVTHRKAVDDAVSKLKEIAA